MFEQITGDGITAWFRAPVGSVSYMLHATDVKTVRTNVLIYKTITVPGKSWQSFPRTCPPPVLYAAYPL